MSDDAIDKARNAVAAIVGDAHLRCTGADVDLDAPVLINVNTHGAQPVVSERGGVVIAHIDIDVVLSVKSSKPAVIHDCVVGYGSDEEAAFGSATRQWHLGTWQVIQELLSQDGESVYHTLHDDPAGIAGYHIIHGPLQGFGNAEATEALAEWAISNPLLPQLGLYLEAALGDAELVGVKLLFGGLDGDDTAEVRIRNVVEPLSSAALAALDWPRSRQVGYLRTFALIVRREVGQAEVGQAEVGGGEEYPLPDATTTPVLVPPDLAALVSLAGSDPDMTDAALVDALEAGGLAREPAAKLVTFVPIAFGRRLLEPYQALLTARYVALEDQAREQQLLAGVPEFAIALASVPLVENSAGYLTLASRSAEVAAVSQAILNGADPQSLTFEPLGISWDI